MPGIWGAPRWWHFSFFWQGTLNRNDTLVSLPTSSPTSTSTSTSTSRQPLKCPAPKTNSCAKPRTERTCKEDPLMMCLAFWKLPSSVGACLQWPCLQALTHWTHHPCVGGPAWSSQHHKQIKIMGMILPFLGRKKYLFWSKVSIRDAWKSARGCLLSVQVQGFMYPVWALVLKALLHCCLKRKNKLVRIFKCLACQ